MKNHKYLRANNPMEKVLTETIYNHYDCELWTP